MKQPLQLRFVGMEPSAALEAAVQEKVHKLDQFRSDLMSCRVTLAVDDKHKHQGRHFAVRIDLTFPGGELCVDKARGEDAYVALRDAFDDMKRQLQDAVQRSQDRSTAAPHR
ncbi:HPF/RaiA family ribosome-associated protein [Ideonella dechloratans]|jgi:ribosomal subunit interface protein|uniref:HPF/RaiA family ribosome-associated protein n=1 Tax=Ideonella dechloratans TaxID=36863 RepID=UPI001E47F3A2|nr:HPF/RaiA family ribosome-associated protein [Ideonella dechloratans]UFU12240.1 HPF/RaiA family ribosome-associated protein [Ideonella dechloratans]